MGSTMSRFTSEPVQEIRISTETYCLIRKREYERLCRNAGAGYVDALEYAGASIGRSLRRARRRAGMTQSQVAARAGIRLETLSRLENGRGNPTVRTVRRILQALGERV